MHPEVSIVIPVYNSEKTISHLISSIIKEMERGKLDFEIVLVDDCSQDNSWEVIKLNGERDKRIKGLSLLTNRGQFEALMIGTAYTQGHFIIHMDDDLEHPTEELLNLYLELKKSSDKIIVFGMDSAKYQKKGKSTSIAKCRNYLLNLFWGKYETDSYRVFRREVVFKSDQFIANSPMLEIYLSYHVPIEKVGYIDVKFNKIPYRSSGYSFFKKVLFFIRYTPFYIALIHYLLAYISLLLLLVFCWDQFVYIIIGVIGIVWLAFAQRKKHNYRLSIEYIDAMNIHCPVLIR